MVIDGCSLWGCRLPVCVLLFELSFGWVDMIVSFCVIGCWFVRLFICIVKLRFVVTVLVLALLRWDV